MSARFEGIVIIEEMDSQGDIINVDGCDISMLKDSFVFKDMNGREVEHIVGHVVEAKKDVTDDGKKCIRVVVELSDALPDLGQFSIGAFGKILEKEPVPCPGEEVGREVKTGRIVRDACDDGKLRDGPWGSDVDCAQCRGTGKAGEHILKAAIDGMALVDHNVHPAYVLKRSKP